ncbi:electron transfer flavoprotein subunit alpha/FixB family protein [Changpingibacter yushuensis]|uniref:electron transfer flavoprotein subunit alpha/FixB family protein n=1 Tax=Changpingibacter yushuensis TaxID=2758440 RepID=UPI00165D6856|nr:electron transfer flavoprotein subunit alpha/FixB family protein [Changpingibacter yushuensis]
MKALIIAERPELVSELLAIATEAGATEIVSASFACDTPSSTATDFSLTSNSSRPEDLAGPVAKLAASQSVDAIFCAATIAAREFAPRAATRLDIAYIPDAEHIALTSNGGTAERVVYAGGAIQDVEWSGPAIFTVSVRPAPVPTATKDGAVVNDDDADDRVVRQAIDPLPPREEDVANASRIVCVGMGVASQESLQDIEKLTEVLGASLACTRPIAEDRHWLPGDRYIGISGQHVAPALYLGLGVSGQVQHAVGMRGSRVVVEVNVDPNAPSMKEADHAVVGDAVAFTAALTAALQARG